MKAFILFLVFIVMLAGIYACTAAPKVAGEYEAVTLTELVIELTLSPGGKAILTSGYLPIAPDEPGLFTLNGTWRYKGGIVYIEFKDYANFSYKVVEYLPYKEFGCEGGSFGLSPVKRTKHPITRYGLWRKEALKQLQKGKRGSLC